MTEELIHSEERGEIVLYQPNDNMRLEVRLQDDTVWLTQQQMTELFKTTKQNVSLHINNIFKEGELVKDSVVKESLTTASYVQLPHAVHARYLITDDAVWLLGTSVKDMGRSLCTIIKVGFSAEQVLNMVSK